ncbi:MAG: hypothetical protein KDC16_07840 [Saprospiraceae bacterium]|nr:hypothetical protein [Saprospiraceae bacterium]MCB9329361.1 hypothetical protein [Lewinellaceae bacterium]
MDTNDILDIQDNSGLNVNSLTQNHLYQIAKWGKIISIIIFVYIGLMILYMFVGMSTFMALFMGGLSDSMDPSMDAGFGAFGVFFMILFGGMLLFGLYLNYLLYKFSTTLKMALDDQNSSLLTESFSNLKNLFKIYGIILIIVVAIYIIAFLGTISTILLR